MLVRQLSLWLQPEQAAAAELDAVIARLAVVHSTAAFSSHLTVLGPFDQDMDEAVSGLSEVAEQLSPLRVTFSEVRCERAWQRSIYLAALTDPALRRVFDVAAPAFRVPGKPGFEPHLSLQYSELPVADKLRLAGDLAIDTPMTVGFDRLSLWHTAGSDATRWRLIASHPLSGR